MIKTGLVLLISLFIAFKSMAQLADVIDKNTQLKSALEPKQAVLSCEYVITNEWDTGFTGVVQLTNISESDVDGWQVQWILKRNVLTNTWNADIETLAIEQTTEQSIEKSIEKSTQHNMYPTSKQYIASNLQWNQIIEVGKIIEFGFQGDKLEQNIEIPEITGENCQSLNIEVK